MCDTMEGKSSSNEAAYTSRKVSKTGAPDDDIMAEGSATSTGGVVGGSNGFASGRDGVDGAAVSREGATLERLLCDVGVGILLGSCPCWDCLLPCMTTRAFCCVVAMVGGGVESPPKNLTLGPAFLADDMNVGRGKYVESFTHLFTLPPCIYVSRQPACVPTTRSDTSPAACQILSTIYTVSYVCGYDVTIDSPINVCLHTSSGMHEVVSKMREGAMTWPVGRAYYEGKDSGKTSRERMSERVNIK